MFTVQLSQALALVSNITSVDSSQQAIVIPLGAAAMDTMFEFFLGCLPKLTTFL